MKKKKILIVAGEASGDLHAAFLVNAIKTVNPHIEIFGIGGKLMKDQGVHILHDIVEFAVVGFVEIIKHLKTFKNIFNELLALLDKKKPDAVVLVDYPGFNLRFAKHVKAKNIPVIYYISPQIWAWGQNRISEIKKCVDKMIVVFGFEEELYKQAGIKVHFVGHPFLDIVKPSQKKEGIIKISHIKPHTLKIALLPGSREKEIEKHLPVMLKACELIKKELPNTEFILSRRRELGRSIYNRNISSSRIKPHSAEDRPYDILEISDLVIVSSGSATLETAIMQRPMVVIYKTSFITWLLAKAMIKIPNIALVNIVAGKRIVPELIQFQVTPENIAKNALEILKDPSRQKHIRHELKDVKKKLGEQGAASRAAHIITTTLFK